VLSPAFDLLSTRLVLPESVDAEEMALTVNGKRAKITRKDMLKFASGLGIPDIVAVKTLNRLATGVHGCGPMLEESFLTPDSRQKYLDLIQSRAARIAT